MKTHHWVTTVRILGRDNQLNNNAGFRFDHCADLTALEVPSNETKIVLIFNGKGIGN